MIKSWKHKGLKLFFETGDKSGIIPQHEKKLKSILQRLDAATKAEDVYTPSIKFHTLTGDKLGFYAVTVSGNWRVIFKFPSTHAEDVNYLDYH